MTETATAARKLVHCLQCARGIIDAVSMIQDGPFAETSVHTCVVRDAAGAVASPLEYALGWEHDVAREMLRRRGLDKGAIKRRSSELIASFLRGRLALEDAARAGLLRLLLDAGADPNVRLSGRCLLEAILESPFTEKATLQTILDDPRLDGGCLPRPGDWALPQLAVWHRWAGLRRVWVAAVLRAPTRRSRFRK